MRRPQETVASSGLQLRHERANSGRRRPDAAARPGHRRAIRLDLVFQFARPLLAQVHIIHTIYGGIVVYSTRVVIGGSGGIWVSVLDLLGHRGRGYRRTEPGGSDTRYPLAPADQRGVAQALGRHGVERHPADEDGGRDDQ